MSLATRENLMGAKNYISWHRSIEIDLLTKRKLAFVQGGLSRPADDPIKAHQWDASNNMIIPWIMNTISNPIARLVFYTQFAREV